MLHLTHIQNGKQINLESQKLRNRRIEIKLQIRYTYAKLMKCKRLLKDTMYELDTFNLLPRFKGINNILGKKQKREKKIHI